MVQTRIIRFFQPNPCPTYSFWVFKPVYRSIQKHAMVIKTGNTDKTIKKHEIVSRWKFSKHFRKIFFKKNFLTPLRPKQVIWQGSIVKTSETKSAVTIEKGKFTDPEKYRFLSLQVIFKVRVCVTLLFPAVLYCFPTRTKKWNLRLKRALANFPFCIQMQIDIYAIFEMKRKCKTVFNTVGHWFHNYLALLAPTGVLYVVMHHYLSAPTFLDTQTNI